MTLAEYFDSGSDTVSAGGGLAALSRTMIYDYIKGESLPGLRVAARIERLTGGKVTLYDWETGEEVKETAQLEDLL